MIRLSADAAARLAQGGIARGRVEITFASPDRLELDPSDPSLTRGYQAIDAVGGRILHVVHRPDGPDMLVITAFFDRDAGP